MHKYYTCACVYFLNGQQDDRIPEKRSQVLTSKKSSGQKVSKFQLGA